MKKRILACVLACAMLLMGTGYAYWTNLLNVNAKAETGKLNVNFTKAEYVGNNFAATGALTAESAYDSTTHTPTLTDDKNVTFDVTEIYPGHYEVFSTEVNNAGTVAAKLGKIKASISSSNDMTESMIGIAIAGTQSYTTEESRQVDEYGWDWVFVPCDPNCNKWGHCHTYVNGVRGIYVLQYTVVGSHIEKDSTTHTTPVDHDALLGLPQGSTFTIGTVTFVRLSALDDLSVSQNLLYLNNASNMKFNVWIGMDPDAAGDYTTGSSVAGNPKGNYDINTQHTSASVTLGFVWDQYNQK